MPKSDSQELLTAKIAKRFLTDPDSVDLRAFTAIEDAAAKSLSKHEGDLYLEGLTSLSDAAAKSLSKHKGELQFDGLTSLSDSPGHVALANKLSKHCGLIRVGLEGVLSLRGRVGR